MMIVPEFLLITWSFWPSCELSSTKHRITVLGNQLVLLLVCLLLGLHILNCPFLRWIFHVFRTIQDIILFLRIKLVKNFPLFPRKNLQPHVPWWLHHLSGAWQSHPPGASTASWPRPLAPAAWSPRCGKEASGDRWEERWEAQQVVVPIEALNVKNENCFFVVQ